MTDMVETEINGRWELLLPRHRAERPEWRTGWETERLVAMHSAIMLHDGTPVVFDIGMEEGDITGLMASWEAELHVFEPNPLVWPNARAVWEANDLPALGGWFVGFAAADTDLYPHDPDPAIGATAWGAAGWPECAYGPVIGDHGFRTIVERSHDTPRVRIDDYVDMTDAVPDIITMDVEGAEWEVLRGAERTLDTARPTVFISVHPEFLFRQYQEYEGDMHRWLRDHGYVGQHLAYDHEHHWEYLPVERAGEAP